MRILALAFALVALGHLVYLPGELSPITASTLFDLATAALLGWVALVMWRGDALPRAPLVALGAIKAIDYAMSFGSGFHDYHVGWTGIALGGALVAWGAYRGAAAWLRVGAGIAALGAADYVYLALTTGGAAFFVGATLVLVGWALVAWRGDDAAPETIPADATA